LAEAATGSLRLTGLRYRAGEFTAQEGVDSQNTLTQAGAGYADAQARDRVAANVHGKLLECDYFNHETIAKCG
jgi:outer membrane protein TolC